MASACRTTVDLFRSGRGDELRVTDADSGSRNRAHRRTQGDEGFGFKCPFGDENGQVSNADCFLRQCCPVNRATGTCAVRLAVKAVFSG